MRKGADPGEWKVAPLASEHTVICQSADPGDLYLDRVSLLALPGGRLVAACDQCGPGVAKLPGTKGREEHSGHLLQGRIRISADKGQTWTSEQTFPFCDPCLFRDRDRLFLVGRNGNIMIMWSEDGGTTWRPPKDLTPRNGPGAKYVECPVNALSANGSVYLAMMQYTGSDTRMTSHGKRAIVIMRAGEGSNMWSQTNWVFSAPTPPFGDMFPDGIPDYFGIPFFAQQAHAGGRNAPQARWVPNPGWSGPQCVLLEDPGHFWSDAKGHALLVLASAEVHRSSIAMVARVSESEKAMGISLLTTPAGKKMAFLPLPGGNMRFSVIYDEPSKLFWLLGNQVTDSMRDAGKQPAGRQMLPCEQIARLVLHYSRNLVDWSFAGYVAGGASEAQPRRSASMAVRGNDLCIACCSGDEHCADPRRPNIVTFHCVPNFRELVY